MQRTIKKDITKEKSNFLEPSETTRQTQVTKIHKNREILWKEIQAFPTRSVTPEQLEKDIKEIKEEISETEF